MEACIIEDKTVICNMGCDLHQIVQDLCAGKYGNMPEQKVASRMVPAGAVTIPLPDITEEKWNTRTNALLLHCLQKLKPLWKNIPAPRIGVVLGSSNSGIEEYHRKWKNKELSDEALAQLEVGNVAAFVAKETGAEGPCYTLSTACSSSAKALISGARLLEAGLCDMVIAGGGDALCNFALHGFDALHLISGTRSEALTLQGGGVNHGEGAALFILTRREAQPGDIIISGYGESADAYHTTTPEPSGADAARAMRMALKRAGLTPDSINYVNLHGTGTDANDGMELEAMRAVFGTKQPPCGSTKPYMGHTLGAAGAIEAAICTGLLESGDTRLPLQPWLQNRQSPEGINLTTESTGSIRHTLSNSFAFGGNNVALIISRHA